MSNLKPVYAVEVPPHGFVVFGKGRTNGQIEPDCLTSDREYALKAEEALHLLGYDKARVVAFDLVPVDVARAVEEETR